jgi:hypothetical protein
MSAFFWKGFLVLSLGQSYDFKPNGSAVWISSKTNVSTQSLPNKILITPLKKNETFFVSGLKIEGQNIDKIARFLTLSESNFNSLKKCKHSELSFSEGRMSALLKKTDDLDKISQCDFEDLRISNKLNNEITELFNKNENILRRSGFSFTKTEWINGKRVLTTSQKADHLLANIPQQLKAFYEIQSQESKNSGNTLIFELTLFEFSRHRARDLGLKWPQKLSILELDKSGNIRSHLKSNSGSNSILAADFGESQGVGKILSQPTLRTQPGTESRFMSGGEFPIKNQGAFQSETIWKHYGLKISLKPESTIKAGDREVSVDFKLEYSEPDMGQMIEGIPSLLQRQLESRFALRMDETTILTTMLSFREGKSKEGTWGVSNIPILGLLFSSEQKLKNNTELCFALKPTWDEIPQQNSNKNLSYENEVF